ncbi:MAG: ABC transporter ATP-binding protein [Salinarimonadaceae bacterium]|nr:MAG: ABC transporter ATP-binding protein [Salinarimonadaceae bacterium]
MIPQRIEEAPVEPVLSEAPVRIRVKGLTKKFQRHGGQGEIIPVNNVTLDVAEDEIVVLLGPSGCGKTTLLRCVAGLEKPDEGEIHINDQLVFCSRRGVNLPPNKRPVSMVFQSYALWPHMTVLENVAYPLRTRGLPDREVVSRAVEALETVGLGHLTKQYPGQISGGQQQRVALARAVVGKTGVVLFDEPLSNVDAKVREQLRLEIRRMQRELRFTALYVTHDQSEAMALADRIAVLGNGVIEQIGTAEDVYNLPYTDYVGTFIGNANIWRGRVTKIEGSRVSFSAPFADFTVDAASGAMLGAPVPAPEAYALLLARPESILVHPAPPADETNSFESIVESRVFLGSHTEYILRMGEERIRSWIPSISSIEEGATAWWSVSPGLLRFLVHSAAADVETTDGGSAAFGTSTPAAP